MAWFKKTQRLLRIVRTLTWYNLDNLLWNNSFKSPPWWLWLFFPKRWFGNRPNPTPIEIRQAFETLGPIFVKFGQLLSTRRDLIADDVALELALLQDQVTPFSSTLALNIIQTSLGGELPQFFSEFSLEPLASASIAQVHAAKLLDGTPVVVKVLRPGIQSLIMQDLALLYAIAKILNRYFPNTQRFHPISIIAEFEITLLDELDLLKEAANGTQLRRNFERSPLLYVPKIYWDFCRHNMIVMERVYGLPISAVDANLVDVKRLAEQGVEIFFTQVFRDCFFHADMHPGNILVDTHIKPARYIAIDFGIMGSLSPEDQRYLGENFLAFFKRDYRRVAELHIQSGWVPPNTRLAAFESAIRTVCEPIFERPLKDISFGQTLLRLFQTASRFQMEVQPQLLLLQKTLLTVEGVGRQLYPDLDLWHTAKPFLEKWMHQNFGWPGLMKKLELKIPVWNAKLPELPEALYEIAKYWQQEAHHRQYYYQKPITKPSSQTHDKKYLGYLLIIIALLLASKVQFLSNINHDFYWIVITIIIGLIAIIS